MGILTLIQEQNSFPGITNKLLAKKVNRICVAYEGMAKYFPKEKIVLTGNPIRKEMIEIQGKEEAALKLFNLSSEKPVVLVIGGSQGALSINKSIHSHLNQFVENGIQLIWQTGKYFFETAQESAKEYHPKGIRTVAFIDRMDYAYSISDIVVCRAGATTIAELTRLGKPAILVPYPHAAANHQVENAQALSETGAAVMVYDNEISEKISGTIMSLIGSDRLGQMSEKCRQLGKPQAASVIAKHVIHLAQNYGRP